MVKPELGQKRQCVACGTRFYDLLKQPATCPKCGTEQPAELPRTRRPGSAAADLRARKPVPVAEPAMEEAETEEAETEEEEVLEDTSDLEDGDADLASDIVVEEPDDTEER